MSRPKVVERQLWARGARLLVFGALACNSGGSGERVGKATEPVDSIGETDSAKAAVSTPGAGGGDAAYVPVTSEVVSVSSGETGAVTDAVVLSHGSSAAVETASAESALVTGRSDEASEAPSLPECRTDEDCQIALDCCSCRAEPKGATSPACRLDCEAANGCELAQLDAEPTCRFGRCTLSVTCDRRRVTCKAEPPTCPSGQVPSVTEQGCWGPCVAVTECTHVTDCAACGDAMCVEFPNVAGTNVWCLEQVNGCSAGNLCECMLPCGNFPCVEQDSKLGCYCAGC